MLRLRPLALSLALSSLAFPAFAQTYPSQTEGPVTDDAEMLSPVQEAELAEQIIAIEQDGNADLALVTLISTALYTAGEENADYAQGLIENWELGQQSDGRAVLILIFRDDSEMVVEFGPGFSGGETAPIQGIIDETIIPAFERSNLTGGLRDGIAAINDQIIAPQTVSAPETTTTSEAADAEGGGNALLWIGGIVAAVAAAIFGLNRRSAAKLAATPCPQCGATGLRRERVTLTEATEAREGSGEVRTSCPSCGHVTTKPFTIPLKSADKPAAKTGDGTPPKGGSGSW